MIDLFNREVVGWAIADHHRADLICEAADQDGETEQADQTSGDLPFGSWVGIHLTPVQTVFEGSEDAGVDGPGGDVPVNRSIWVASSDLFSNLLR